MFEKYMIMTRKCFLQTLAGVAAYAYIPESYAHDPAPKCRIKRSVSLYSYQEEYYAGAMTLEDCIAEVADMGAEGIEILGEEMVPDFPNPSDKWVDQWFSWMDKYRTTPCAFDGFFDGPLSPDNRPLSEQEGIDMLLRDLKLANRLGFKVLRTIHTIPRNVIEKCIPYAEKLDVAICFETHAPTTLKDEYIDWTMELATKKKTKHLGFVPDFGIFMRRPPRIQRDRRIRDGALKENIAGYIKKAAADSVPRENAAAEVARMGGGQGENAWLNSVFNTRMENPQDLLRIMPYAFHCHAKFYEMTEEYREYSIPCEEVVPVLIQAGYDKYLSSEYEGQRTIQDAFEVDSCEQVRR